MKPMAATAMTAAVVAIVPSSVPCNQLTALTRTPEPCGSTRVAESYGQAGSELIVAVTLVRLSALSYL